MQNCVLLYAYISLVLLKIHISVSQKYLRDPVMEL